MSPTVEQVKDWSEDLGLLHGRIAPRFARAEPRQRAVTYIQGLLSPVERTNGWQLAEHAGEATPHGTPRLLKAARWKAEGVGDDLWAYVLENLGPEAAVLVVAETGVLKKGAHSVGVKRPYSGMAGRIENCQVGVFLAYASEQGTAFIDRELFLPKEWAQDKARRKAAGVPKARKLLSKPQLAQQLLGRAVEAGVKASWVVADTVYASWQIRNMLEARKQPYILAAASNFMVRFVNAEGIQQPHIATLFKTLEPNAWQELSAGTGTKGARLYDWAWLSLRDVSTSHPAWAPLIEAGFDRWFLARRSLTDLEDLAYYTVVAPERTTLAEVVQVAGMRGTIETGFEATKGEAGLDDYETRSWQGWYRHITLSLLAHAFALFVPVRLKRGRRRS